MWDLFFTPWARLNFKVKMQGRTGFNEGQFILNQILESSGMEEKSNDLQGRYYARL